MRIEARNVTFRFGSYLWAVAHLVGEEPIVSTEIAAAVGINATQVRRDLLTKGRNGTRGLGYGRSTLRAVLAPPCPVMVSLIGTQTDTLVDLAVALTEFEHVDAHLGFVKDADITVSIDDNYQTATVRACRGRDEYGCRRFLNLSDYILVVDGCDVANMPQVRTILEAVMTV